MNSSEMNSDKFAYKRAHAKSEFDRRERPPGRPAIIDFIRFVEDAEPYNSDSGINVLCTNIQNLAKALASILFTDYII